MHGLTNVKLVVRN